MWLHFSNVVVIFRPVINLSFFFSIAKHLCTSLLAKRGSQGGGGEKRIDYESSEAVTVSRYLGTKLKIAKGLHAEIRAG